MRELLEEALKYLSKYGTNFDLEKRIEAELAKPEPETSGWIWKESPESSHRSHRVFELKDHCNYLQSRYGGTVEPLYTHPPEQQKSITDEEIMQLWKEHIINWDDIKKQLISPVVFARSIERRVRGE